MNPLSASYFQQLQQALTATGLAEPVLVIDRDRLDTNIAALKAMLPAGMAIEECSHHGSAICDNIVYAAALQIQHSVPRLCRCSYFVDVMLDGFALPSRLEQLNAAAVVALPDLLPMLSFRESRRCPKP